jgi:hypothetical protein
MFPKGGLTKGWSRFCLKSEIFDPAKGYLVDGTTVKVHVKIDPKEELVHTKLHSQCGPMLLSQQLKMLMDDPEFSDVTLVADSVSFQANKSILAGNK